MKIFPNKPSVRQKNFVNSLIKSFLQTLYKTGAMPSLSLLPYCNVGNEWTSAS